MDYLEGEGKSGKRGAGRPSRPELRNAFTDALDGSKYKNLNQWADEKGHVYKTAYGWIRAWKVPRDVHDDIKSEFGIDIPVQAHEKPRGTKRPKKTVGTSTRH